MRYLWWIHCNMLKCIFMLCIRSPDWIKCIPHKHQHYTCELIYRSGYNSAVDFSLSRNRAWIFFCLKLHVYAHVQSKLYFKYIPVIKMSSNRLVCCKNWSQYEFFQHFFFSDKNFFTSSIEIKNTSLQVPYKEYSSG